MPSEPAKSNATQMEGSDGYLFMFNDIVKREKLITLENPYVRVVPIEKREFKLESALGIQLIIVVGLVWDERKWLIQGRGWRWWQIG